MGLTAAGKHIISRILEEDRAWSAYALADLTPGFIEDTTWYVDNPSLVMTYSGIQPDVLFTMGHPDQLECLLQQIPSGLFQYSSKHDHIDVIQKHMRLNSTLPMKRMVLDPELFPTSREFNTVPLTRAHIDDILNLFEGCPDQPDAFTPAQLDQGAFFGIRMQGRLVSMAGTHVVSQEAGIAAVGNVFTAPDFRGRGLATRTTGSVTGHLLGRGISTIVLNVSESNPPAIRTYKKLGYCTACSYYEGTGTIT